MGEKHLGHVSHIYPHHGGHCGHGKKAGTCLSNKQPFCWWPSFFHSVFCYIPEHLFDFLISLQIKELNKELKYL